MTAAIRHLHAPTPLHFPEHETVGESKRHLELRTLLYQILSGAFADRAAIGCDQFVYYDASNPKACLAPDAFVRLGVKDSLFGSWKVWERGAPEVAVEIVSESDESPAPWAEKLERYHRLGVVELVRFDAEADEGERLRVWDRVQGDLVERVVETDRAESGVLGGAWVVVPDRRLGLALRLAEANGKLVPTAAEARAEDAERRVAELEAELRKRG